MNNNKVYRKKSDYIPIGIWGNRTLLKHRKQN